MANEHVEWVRRQHPEAADRTITLHRLVRDLTPPGEPLPARLKLLQPATVHLSPGRRSPTPRAASCPSTWPASRRSTT